MADLRLLVTTVFDNKELKEGTEEIKSTFNELNRLNNSTLNTSNKQINEIQRQINDLFNRSAELERSIRERQSSLNQDLSNLKLEKSSLEELRKQFQFLAVNVGMNITEDIMDAAITIETGRITPNQALDTARALDPRNVINEMKIIAALAQLGFKLDQKDRSEFMIDTGLIPGTSFNVKQSKEELEKDLEDIHNRIAELFGIIDENVAERIQRQFPDFFEAFKKFKEIEAKQQEIANLETNITGNEATIAQEKAELDVLSQSVSDLLEQRDALGDTLFPEIDLGIDEDTFNLENLTFPQMKLELGPLDPEIQKRIQEEIDNTSGAIDEQSSSLGLLEGSLASANGHLVAGAGVQSEFLIVTENTAEELQNEAESLSNAESSLGGLVSQGGTFVGLQGQINQTVGEGAIAFEGAGAAAVGFGDTLENVDSSGKKDETEENPQNVIFLDEFRENEQEFKLAA